MISIQLLKKENTDEALLFLQPYESECVNLASEILRGATDCWAIYYAEQAQAQEARDQNCSQAQKGAAAEQEASQTSGTENESMPAMLDCRISRNIRACEARANSGIVSQDQKLAGLIALRKKRSLFFCLPFAKYKSAFDKKVCSEAQRPLMEFFESREPFCVNGEAAGAIFLRNILKNKKSSMRPSVTNKYFLMVSDEAFHAQDAGGLRVVQATAADYERLLPLELGYQREEVVPKSFDISDAALAAAFKHELCQGLTFALYDGDRPIAKARVSARGTRHCMLGGVYTIPSERKKGRAAFLVRQIIARQSLAFNAFCLYAKQENSAALALYKSLGFTPRGEYLLVYY